MKQIESDLKSSDSTAERAADLFREHQQVIFKSTDRMFAVLMAIQWVAGIAAAYWISPRTWAGTSSQTHPHVWAALLLGGAISCFPIALALTRPGEVSTRYFIATAQMLMSALLIHLTGGRIETHFHVFGSLAFLSFYRDWRVLVPATLVVAADHFVRGIFWPQSVYGVLTVSEWRWLEHAGWVLFEDTFLFIAIKRSVREMWDIARRTADLNAGEERYRSVVEQTAEGIFLVDPKTKRILEGNAAFRSLVGYTPEEVPGLTIYDFVTDDRQMIDALAERILKERRPFTSERIYRRKDDSNVDVEVNVSVISYDGRDVFCTVARNITERKHAEEAIRKSKEYRNLFKLANDPILILDLEREAVLDVNDKACEKYGIPRESFINRSVQDLSQDSKEQQRLMRFLSEGTHQEFGAVQHHADGTPIYFLINSSIIEYQGRQAVLCINRDITERKRIDEELARQRSFLRQVIDVNPNFIFAKDREGRFTLVNQAVADAYGATVEDLLSKPDAGFNSGIEELRQSNLDELEVIDSLREQFIPEEMITDAAGKVRWLQTIKRPIVSPDGTANQMLGVATDITERKQAEEMLAQQARELARSNAELEKFAYVASHDLQEPLRMVTSYTQMLARRYQGQLDEEADEFIEQAVDGAKRMQTLIEDLLAYSRVGTGAKEFVPTDLNTVVANTLKDLCIAMQETGAVVTCDTLPTVTADAFQMRQVFQNLIGNSIKFCQNHPPRVHVSAKPNSHEWLLSVRDNGIGIEPKYAKQIFEIFQRLHRRDAYPGTGIGLAICQKIVEHHNGRIWMEPQGGEGTTFFFTLPG